MLSNAYQNPQKSAERDEAQLSRKTYAKGQIGQAVLPRPRCPRLAPYFGFCAKLSTVLTVECISANMPLEFRERTQYREERLHMPEDQKSPSSFKVVDRRTFSEDGSVRRQPTEEEKRNEKPAGRPSLAASQSPGP